MISINIILAGYLILYLLASLADLGIGFLNMHYLRKFGQTVPEILAADVNKEHLSKSSACCTENNRFAMVKAIVGKILFLSRISWHR